MMKKNEILEKKIDKLIELIQRGNFENFIDILGNKKQIAKRNIIAGIFRGVGIGIGVTVVTAILILILRKVVALNLPIIGEYIADIVQIVEMSR